MSIWLAVLGKAVYKGMAAIASLGKEALVPVSSVDLVCQVEGTGSLKGEVLGSFVSYQQFCTMGTSSKEKLPIYFTVI
jgi:hypothetical protein